jgi:hypothetical protein
MKTVNVTFSHANMNGQVYYRTIPNEQLICICDGTWHTAIDDDCWEEADAPINPDYYDIKVVEPCSP